MEIEILTIDDLLKYEKASRIVCKKYENSCKTYDGSITNREEYEKFLVYNNIHERIINAIEKDMDNNLK